MVKLISLLSRMNDIWLNGTYQNDTKHKEIHQYDTEQNDT
jgi:hypothetical protein